MRINCRILDLETAANSDDQSLTVTQKSLLDYLRQRAGRVVSRDELAAEVWKQPRFQTRTIDQTIAMLRKHLRNGKATILTVRGVGYRYVAEL